ncbi:MAG: MauE/DoxX family redox-associated membrane protein [Myxococcota bacterium]|nr:MauE/DoxX family redox-associated membrane protein [Myxococcota bacterium]
MAAFAVDPVVHAVLRAALALLLLSAAVQKLRDARGFRAVLADYQLLPARLVPAAALALTGIEFAVGAGLLVPTAGAAPVLAAALLLSAYAGAIALNLARGRRHVSCGCAGPAGTQTLHEGLVARNGLLVLAALLAAGPAAPRPLVWVDAVTGVGGIALLALVYVASDVALANASRVRTLRGTLRGTRRGTRRGAMRGTRRGAMRGTRRGAMRGTRRGAMRGTLRGAP